MNEASENFVAPALEETIQRVAERIREQNIEGDSGRRQLKDRPRSGNGLEAYP